MPVLWIFVNFGAVPDALSGEQLYVQCSIGSQKASTDPTKEHPPVWFTEMCFGDANQTDAVLIELKQKGFLWDSVIASVSAPLKFIPYSSQHGDGTWVQMVSKGDSQPSDKHRLFMDLRFDFPDDLTMSEKAALESKLPVLTDEVEKLDDQNRRLKEGSLSVPRPTSPVASVSLSTPRKSSASPDSDDRPPSVVDPIPSVAATDHNNSTMDVEVASLSISFQEANERDAQTLADLPDPVPRRRLLHQGYIDGSEERDSKEEEREEEKGNHVVTDVMESPTHLHLPKSAHRLSQESFESTETEGLADSPHRLRRGQAVKIRSRHASTHSDDRSSAGKLSAGQSSILSEDQSKSDSSSSDNVPAPELTQALNKFLELRSPTRGAADGSTGASGPLQISTSVMNQFGTQQCFDIKADHIVTPSRRFTMRNKTLRMTVLRPQAPTHHGDDLDQTAYCKAVQALINPPLTDEDQHSFEVWSAHKPTFCTECSSLLWGVARQGYKCTKCGLKCHERCATLVNADCSLYAAKRQEMKRAGSETVDDKFVGSHVLSRLEKQISLHQKDQLEVLSECFGVSPIEHQQLLERAKREVLQHMTSFKAVIKVRVIAAEKLAIREEDSNSIYVSVSVGGQRKRTKTFREQHRNPVWNEEFTFDCDNAMDRIKVRVWNESSDNAMTKISHVLTKERDQFLGEKVIEVQSLGETTNIRHKLEKRTRESVVSGKVRLEVSAKDDKGYMVTPYHELYNYVHTKLFNHAHLTQALPLVKADISHGEEPFEMLLPPAFQQISNAFAKRYSIDPLAMAITHFKCLSQHYIVPQALEIMCVLLREIMSEVLDREEQSLAAHYQETEGSYNRGKKHGRLASILQQLLNSLRIDLQSYREVFPADEADKLEEFKHAIKLVQLIVECQHEALDECRIDPSILVEDSMRQCGKATFEVLMQECLAATAEKYPAGSDRTANPKEFFLGLMQLLVAAILEDRNCYESHVAPFCKFSLGDLTAHELWYILGERLCEMLDKQMEDDTFPATDYINLLLALNQMYKDYISKKGEPVPTDVEFPTWFEFYVLKWMKGYEDNSMNVTTKAVVSDRNGQFAALESKHLSSSVYDIFWWLHEGNKILDKLSCNNTRQHQIYYAAFAEMIDHVLRHYVALIAECIEDFRDNLAVSLMLLNDLHHSRVNLQNLYESMGGVIRAGEGCSQVLTEMQVFLAQELTTQCSKVAGSLYGVILQGVRVVKTEATRVKGVVKTQVTSKDVAPLVSDLMNTLASRGSMMLKGCEESVLKKLVKELWQVTVQAFHDCLLPASRPAGRAEGSSAAAAAVSLNFSQRQCLHLEQVLIVVKDFFLSLKEVHLKPKALDQSLAPLRKILSIYQQTTSSLIGQFVLQETEQDVGEEGARNLGEISLQLETSIHPGSQELEITIHVMSVSGLKSLSPGSAVQKPFVEICLVGPNIHGITRRYRTAPAKGTGQNFVFAHEVKRMTIPHAVKFEELELQVMVKSQGFFVGGGHLLGLTILQLRNHLEQGFSQQLDLVGKLKISPEGEAIISVLSQRGTDELAKEFVSLKQEERKGLQAAAGN